jgi:hypothetical protein
MNMVRFLSKTHHKCILISPCLSNSTTDIHCNPICFHAPHSTPHPPPQTHHPLLTYSVNGTHSTTQGDLNGKGDSVLPHRMTRIFCFRRLCLPLTQINITEVSSKPSTSFRDPFKDITGKAYEGCRRLQKYDAGHTAKFRCSCERDGFPWVCLDSPHLCHLQTGLKFDYFCPA